MKKTMAMLSAAMIAVGAALCAGWGCGPAAKAAPTTKTAPAATAAAEVVRDGEYCSKGEVAAYIRRFGGALPKNYITKTQRTCRRRFGRSASPPPPIPPVLRSSLTDTILPNTFSARQG